MPPILSEVLTVLDEVARLDDAQKARARQWAELAKRARAGEDRATLDRERNLLASTVIDHGDVWERLLALRPKVRRVLKETTK